MVGVLLGIWHVIFLNGIWHCIVIFRTEVSQSNVKVLDGIWQLIVIVGDGIWQLIRTIFAQFWNMKIIYMHALAFQIRISTNWRRFWQNPPPFSIFTNQFFVGSVWFRWANRWSLFDLSSKPTEPMVPTNGLEPTVPIGSFKFVNFIFSYVYGCIFCYRK